MLDFSLAWSRKQGTLQAFSYLNDACQNLDTFITNLAPGKVQLCNGLVGTQPITQHLQRRISSSSHGAALLRQLTANASGTLHGNTVVPRIISSHKVNQSIYVRKSTAAPQSDISGSIQAWWLNGRAFDSSIMEWSHRKVACSNHVWVSFLGSRVDHGSEYIVCH